MRDDRLERLARLLTEYSTPVTPGAKVHVKASGGALPFVSAVARAAIDRGGLVRTQIVLDEVQEHLLRHGGPAQLDDPDPVYRLRVEEADVMIAAFGGSNTRALTSIPAERQQRRARANRESFDIYRRRAAEGSLKWVATQFPSAADAQEAEMSLAEYEEFVYRACKVHLPDPVAAWREVERRQAGWCERLNAARRFRVTGPGTDLTLDTTGRTWFNDCGHENMPDGEVFTCPVETGVDGHVTFSFPGIMYGREITNVRLVFRAGRVVEAAADKGEDLLRAMLDTDEGARRLGEFAVGTNEEIARFTRNMLFDEKLGGTIHMALGSADPVVGGVNSSAIHWDLLCDMKAGGRIEADGALVYADGKFTI